MNGYIAQGFNPLAAAPNKAKIGASLAKLKWLVIMDPLATETSEFWKNHGVFNDVDTASIQTEVFRLPTTCFAEERGSLVSSSRVLQWHWQGADGPCEAKSDLEIMSGLWLRIRNAYRKDGGKYPDPILKMSWPYSDPTPANAMEFNGKALADDRSHRQTKVLAKGEQLASFAQLTTAARQAAAGFRGRGPRRATRWATATHSDPTGIGNTLNWRAWPATGVYNRAGRCERRRPHRKLVIDGTAGVDGAVGPDFKVDERLKRHESVHHESGVARFSRATGGRPFPEHYEPFERRSVTTRFRDNKAAVSNPAARGSRTTGRPGTHENFPHTTTYRLTETLLDQACASERDHSAGTVRGDRRGSGERGRRGGGGPHQGVVESRARHCRGARHQADQNADN
jgi:formate dehydrogenase major subunit